MNLLAKRILFLIADGADERDIEYLKTGLERESAEVLLTTSQASLTVMTVADGRRGKDIVIDLPIEFADPRLFDGLVVPDGSASIEAILADFAAMRALSLFGEAGRPIVLSGEAGRLAGYASSISDAAFVCDGPGGDSRLDGIVEHIHWDIDTPLKGGSFTGLSYVNDADEFP